MNNPQSGWGALYSPGWIGREWIETGNSGNVQRRIIILPALLVGSGLNNLALEAKLRDNNYSLRDRVSETLTLRHKPRPRTAIVPSFGFTGFFYA